MQACNAGWKRLGLRAQGGLLAQHVGYGFGGRKVGCPGHGGLHLRERLASRAATGGVLVPCPVRPARRACWQRHVRYGGGNGTRVGRRKRHNDRVIDTGRAERQSAGPRDRPRPSTLEDTSARAACQTKDVTKFESSVPGCEFPCQAPQTCRNVVRTACPAARGNCRLPTLSLESPTLAPTSLLEQPWARVSVGHAVPGLGDSFAALPVIAGLLVRTIPGASGYQARLGHIHSGIQFNPAYLTTCPWLRAMVLAPCRGEAGAMMRGYVAEGGGESRASLRFV